jgi:hypothetical protein
MASFSAELHVAGATYPVRYCAYEFTQATSERGRVVAKVRHGLVRLTLDVPDDDKLLDWAHTPYKPLAGRVVFYDVKGGPVLETLAWEEGQCVGYQEEFVSGDQNQGAYVCHLTIAAPTLTLQPGGPAAYADPAPGEHGSPPQALLNPLPLVVSPATPPLEELVLPTVEEVAAVVGEKVLEGLAAAASAAALPVALTLALLLGSTTPAQAPGIPQPHLPPVDPNLLRLNTLVAKHAAGTLTAEEEAELIVLLGQVKGIHVNRLADLPKLVASNLPGPLQKITNKFPEEALASDGRIIPFNIVDGAIKGVNGRKQFDFIIDSTGKLLIGDKHHTLGNRQSVQAAGQIRLNGKGQIRQIDNLSGHYQPSVTETASYPELLQGAGLQVKGATLVTHSITTDADGMVTGIKVVSSKVLK